MPNIIVYSTTYCPYCVRAKQLLDQKGAAYQEIMVDRDPELMQEMMERSQRRSVPQILINDQAIGGYDELAKLNTNGELDSLLGIDT
ncbi:glutaredoxin 3 [Pseudomonadota bacterium]